MKFRGWSPFAISFTIVALAGCGSTDGQGEEEEGRGDESALAGVVVTPGNPCNSNGTTIYSGTGTCSMASGGLVRTYILHVPASYKPGTGSFVMSFHGSGGHSWQEQSQSGLSTSADAHGFAVAYPQGIVYPNGKTSWWDQDILRCGTSSGSANKPDDFGFVRQLIKTTGTQIKNDPKRVYAHGQSAGAHFVHALGVKLADVIAAIAPYAETLYSFHDTATPSCAIPPAVAPVSVLVLHGDQDTYTKYCGAVTKQSDGTYLGTSNVDASFNYWKASNHCASVTSNASFCTGDGGTPTSLYDKQATSCSGGTEVRLYKLIGGWHFFYPYHDPMNQPGDVPYNPDFNAGTGIIMDDVIWNFFNTHPKP